MSHFTLYTNPRSRGRMVRWMLEECEATYEVVPVPYGEPMKSAAYLAVNPMGKVPALKVDDTVLTEALGICTWLAEQFPEKNLIPPAGHVERGEFYRWMCFALHLEYAGMDRRFQLPDNDPERRLGIGYGDFDTAFNTLREHLKTREYMVGDHATVLDLFYGGLLMHFMQPRGTDTDNPRNRPVLSIDDPVLGPYAKRQTSRPAFARAAALDNELATRMASA